MPVFDKISFLRRWQALFCATAWCLLLAASTSSAAAVDDHPVQQNWHLWAR